MDNLEKPDKEAPPPLTLAVETSSRTGSVALAQGPTLLEEAAFSAPMQHSEEIFPTIVQLLDRHGHDPASIRQVHIAIGPGSFTGLRIAVTIAKAMSLAAAARIVSVGSLDVVAANVAGQAGGVLADAGQEREATIPERIAALFDAKRGQFYAAVYERAAGPGELAGDDAGYRIPAPQGCLWRKIVPDSLMTAGEILKASAGAGRFGVLGDGLLYHSDEFRIEGVDVLPEACWSPRAANVFRLGRQKARAGRFEDPSGLKPFYLRGPQVTLKAQA